MAGYGMRKYLGLIFMAVVIAPAVVLSLLAIRAIGHEEAYIEKQLEGTIGADVTHVASVVATELDRIQAELEDTAVLPEGRDPSAAFEAWRRNSGLVEAPFLLSPGHEILWPPLAGAAAEPDEAEEASFAAEQEAFFSDREKIPVYENIAVAYQDEILDERGEAAGEEAPQAREGAMHPKAAAGALKAAPPEEKGAESKKQAAITEFQQSEAVRRKVFDKAELEGQKFAFRNVEPAQTEKEGQEPAAETRVETEKSDATGSPPEAPGTGDTKKKREARSAPPGAPPVTGPIRSIFVSQPLRFSEIVADRNSGIIPRTIDGRLRHIYWQRLAGGDIMGCLIDSRDFRERIVGALPNIYSPVRILTVLDEKGVPLVVPAGSGDRDWRRPFVATEISELLPRWESAAYLTRPDAVSSRARATTVIMWILILILFVSILAGATLVLRSAYGEVRLARQRTSFVANVSHELKTPLTSIRMFAEMLRDGRQTDAAKRKHYLDIMTAEAERLTRLINNVLDFSRMERGEKRYSMRRCDLGALTAEVVESQRARLENNGFDVAFEAGASPVTILADDEAVKQAIVNLLSNAEKYSSSVKSIDVRVAHEGGNATVTVSDRGIGIPRAEAGKIFNEFYRVDDTLTSEVKGAGLGLTIARKILNDHGGDIRYAPREGGGSTFKLMLPPAPEQTGEEI